MPNQETYDEFEEFRKENPWVEEELYEMMKELRARGFAHYGIMTMWGTLRFRKDKPNVKGVSEWSMNNNFTPLYARLLMEEHPEFEGFFAVRQLKG